jgi:hypothetical protein
VQLDSAGAARDDLDATESTCASGASLCCWSRCRCDQSRLAPQEQTCAIGVGVGATGVGWCSLGYSHYEPPIFGT